MGFNLVITLKHQKQITNKLYKLLKLFPYNNNKQSDNSVHKLNGLH